jgi:hypothetical protein
MLKRVVDWKTEIEYSILREGNFVERKKTPLWQHYLSIKHKHAKTLSDMFRSLTYNGWTYVLHSEDLDFIWLMGREDEALELWKNQSFLERFGGR